MEERVTQCVTTDKKMTSFIHKRGLIKNSAIFNYCYYNSYMNSSYIYSRKKTTFEIMKDIRHRLATIISPAI